MALYVNTNVSSLNAKRNLSNSTSSLDTTYKRLASGLRINSAKDDAAGLQISNRLTSQINGLEQGNRNAQDGISYSQTAEGAMDEIVTAKLFCHRNCSPKLSKNIKKLLPIMPSITAHMSYLFWSPKEKRLVHPTRDVNWRRFQEDFEEILEA